MKIIIADDHKVVREGLKKIFSMNEDFQVIGEAASIAELQKLLEDKTPDLITLDVSFPDRSGLDFIKDIKTQNQSIKILVFSMYPDENFGHRALAIGADGYLSKNADPSEIVLAIKKIIKGGKYLKQEVMEELLLSGMNSINKLPHEKLSDREFEVLRLLGQGNKLTAIAEQLNLSINTVASYKSRIQDKLNITSTAALIKYAVENKLV
ncbi:MAG: response regulator transcription factor [Melioribacteraceae bacterium]|nr:response regulator transcription factor [Melioribacteraceae bacterium]